MPVAAPDGRLAGLDTLRAVAIILVIIFHLQQYLPAALHPIAGVGWMGVDLFFVLSGFLIGGQILKPYATGHRANFAAFYTRRAYRILPAYLFILLLYLFVPAWREWPGLAAWWKFLSFTENIFLNYPADLAFSHAWSLCVEEHFYLLLPLLVAGLMRQPRAWKAVIAFALVMLLGLGLRAWQAFVGLRLPGLTDDQVGILYMKHVYYPSWTRLDGLLDGVALAAVQLFRPRWWARLAGRGHALLVSGLAVTSLAVWLFHGAYPDPADGLAVVFGFPLLALGLCLLVAAASCRRGVLAVRVPGAEVLATLAYSLYLSHKAIAHLDRVFLPGLEGQASWRSAGVYAVSCLGFAALLYLCVERPFLVLRDRHPFSRLPVASSQAPGVQAPGVQAPGVQARVDPAL